MPHDAVLAPGHPPGLLQDDGLSRILRGLGSSQLQLRSGSLTRYGMRPSVHHARRMPPMLQASQPVRSRALPIACGTSRRHHCTMSARGRLNNQSIIALCGCNNAMPVHACACLCVPLHVTTKTLNLAFNGRLMIPAGLEGHCHKCGMRNAHANISASLFEGLARAADKRVFGVQRLAGS